MAEEEVLALQGIFCGEGEFEIVDNSGGEWTLSLRVACPVCDQGSTPLAGDSFKVSMRCLLPAGYPDELPTVSLILACEGVTKHSANRLREELHEYSRSLRGRPMIMDLVYWVQENVKNFVTASTITTDQAEPSYAAVLHIDHMRSRTRYVKTLAGWAQDLALTGRLVFLQHLILVLLVGPEDCVKDFLVRLRTQKVDVDSGGRSCKERMMSVLMQGSHPAAQSKSLTSEFRVLECPSACDVERIFADCYLEAVYRETVAPKFNLLQLPGNKTQSKS